MTAVALVSLILDGSAQGAQATGRGGIMTKDPVCGMAIDEAKATVTATYKGRKYYFCSENCKTKFLQDPSQYAHGASGGH